MTKKVFAVGIAIIGVMSVLGAMLIINGVSLSEDRLVKDFLAKGGSPGNLQAEDGKKVPQKLEFIQWGPHREVNKVTRLVRVVYRTENGLYDHIITVQDGKVLCGQVNQYGDNWGNKYDREVGKK